jgi:hypothetical protein
MLIRSERFVVAVVVAVGMFASVGTVDGAATEGFQARESVRIGSGKVAGGVWEVFLYRGVSRSGGARPICLVSATSRKRSGGVTSVLVGSSSCHVFKGGGFWSLVTAIQTRRPDTRILSFAFGSAARGVELVRSSGRVDVMRVDRLTARQAARIGTHNLGFLAIRDHPGDCYEALRVFGREGRRIGGTPLAPC